MGIFQRIEKLVESYLDDLLDSKDHYNSASQSGHDNDMRAAWDELNDFLNAGAAPASGSAANQTRFSNIPQALQKDFAELGVPPGTTLGECKIAYRKQIKVYHPDKKHSSDAAKFMRIKTAYDNIASWYAQNQTV